MSAVQPAIEATGADIRRDALPVVYGDRTMLTQLYRHLLSNALKFNHRQPVIHITVERQDGGWTLGVKDNGIGIKPEYHERIFAPFKRMHGHDEYEGVGIGLSICRKATERHGGHIWIESQVDEGTHAKFTLDDQPPSSADLEL